MKKIINLKKLSGVIALTLTSSVANATDLGVANSFSAFVFDEFKSHVGRADGAIAAGEINLKGVYSVGYNRPSNPHEYYLISETGIEFKRGRQFVGSMLAGGGIDAHWSVRWGMERGATISSHQDESAFPFNFDEQEEHYKHLSAELNNLNETGAVKWKWGGLYLKGDKTSETQVFNIDAAHFAAAHTFKVKGIPKGATVIFNISGDQKVNVRSKNFARLRKHASQTVFNFVDAHNLNIEGSRWEGVILAPYADIKGLFGIAKMPVIGQSFKGSMALLGGEFKGNLPSIVEPIAPFEITQKWSWNSSDFMPEYNQVMSTPVVAQLSDDNNDGIINNSDVADVVVVTFKGSDYSKGVVRALSGIDGSELWDYAQGAIIADAAFSVGAADFDNDGDVEIVATNRFDSFISVVDNNGVTKKQIAKVNSGWRTTSDITIADINNDGSLEFILGDALYNYDIGSLFNFNRAPTSTIFDSNGDGAQEIFTSGKLLDENGAELWSYSGENDIWFSSIADIDNDEKPEVILSIPSGVTSQDKSRIVALEANGNVKWEVNTQANPGGGAHAISNFLGSTKLGIVSAGYNDVTMYNNNGELVWSIPNDDEWSGKIGVSAYDFNGDGIDEVIVQEHLTVRVLNGVNGEVLSSVDNSTASLWEYPIVVDLEGDDNAELVVVSNNYDSRWSINNGVTVYGAADESKPWKNATRIWNQHSYHQTNISQDGKVPEVEKPSWLNNNTYRSSTIK
ncbi:hypothetical protein PspMM1_13630 [Pseudoalteromonas sp. MM1]|uniref:choice-of-anchor A family protein n=1 Tax=Pseudoalteromonas sp. MM1 TaxID=3036714 RepID=UPI0025735796|nr:choice-of-anchor A family protein [Pseudoalteromonas sp. MM1]BED88895.1 hypothetical protein PspMM1_13630 [Pseudoalteromonas sp. MM1]